SVVAFTSLDEFGFDLDGWKVDEETIKRNQTFSDVLQSAGVEYPEIHTIVQHADSVFDIRSWRAGKRYRVYYRDDTLSTPRALVYEHSVVDYVVFELFEPF